MIRLQTNYTFGFREAVAVVLLGSEEHLFRVPHDGCFSQFEVQSAVCGCVSVP